MNQHKIIKAGEDGGIWEQISKDLRAMEFPFSYSASIQENDRTVFLNIEVDPGGGFESGFQTTSLTTPIPLQFTTLSSRLQSNNPELRFVLHNEDFIDKLGKFFGMEDVITGYEEFDNKLIVKTNDTVRIQAAFSDEATRSVFKTLGEFNLHIAYYDQPEKHASLELNIDREITNTEELKKVYDAFVRVVDALEK